LHGKILGLVYLCQSLGDDYDDMVAAWAAQPGHVGGQCPPTFGTSGVQGGTGGGQMKMIFASTPDSLYSVLYK